MKTAKDFWRLLGDYERLAIDEAVALREINLAALARLQGQKTVIANAMLESANESGTTMPAERFQQLIARQNANQTIAQEQLTRMTCEEQNLAAASQRLNHVSRAYKSEAGKKSAILAQG